MAFKSRICSICKGRKLLCGKSKCPTLEKLRAFNDIKQKFDKKLNKNEIFGASPPSIFVGEFNYPNVRMAPLVPPIGGDTSFLDSPLKWENKSIKAIIKYRSMLVMGETKHINVDICKNSKLSKILELIQELAMAVKPVDSEITLKRKPSFDIVPSGFAPPISPKGDLLKFSIAENPKIPSKSDYIVNDELKAVDSIISLYNYGFDEYYIVKLLSAGLLGINKKLVPTRWSITGVQDTIGRYLTKKIIDYPPINDYEVYYNEFLGNRYAILLIPDYYAYELMEVWEKGALFGCDNPPVLGDYEDLKTNGYAKETTGAFYASRLSVLEYLNERKRQSKIVVFREITSDYYAPVGVWQVRTGIKKSFDKGVFKFNTLEEALSKIDELLNNPLERYRLKSRILTKDRQMRIDEFIYL
ncbi:Nre family DNA repair protein [Methanothermococcus sp.]|uniref:Nre family DNA repair protein n=1 Tax=Methanothermococcus sp. TaxID=2614238 RepID=UPI0025D26EFC|nr:Nre family DNA repair protein [Methanothermococcus sp.]